MRTMLCCSGCLPALIDTLMVCVFVTVYVCLRETFITTSPLDVSLACDRELLWNLVPLSLLHSCILIPLVIEPLLLPLLLSQPLLQHINMLSLSLSLASCRLEFAKERSRGIPRRKGESSLQCEKAGERWRNGG